MNNLKITTEFITLGQLLKIENIISSGGEAKFYLQNNMCYVNDEPDNRRGRKLYPNDVVKVEDKIIKIV